MRDAAWLKGAQLFIIAKINIYKRYMTSIYAGMHKLLLIKLKTKFHFFIRKKKIVI
jgi:hypothetical protein